MARLWLADAIEGAVSLLSGPVFSKAVDSGHFNHSSTTAVFIAFFASGRIGQFATLPLGRRSLKANFAVGDVELCKARSTPTSRLRADFHFCREHIVGSWTSSARSMTCFQETISRRCPSYAGNKIFEDKPKVLVREVRNSFSRMLNSG